MKQNENWYDHKETTSLGYKMMDLLLRFFPARFMRFMAFIIGFFYWIFSSGARKISKEYLANLNSHKNSENQSNSRNSTSTLKHFISFALNLVENIQSWAGKFSFKNVSWQNDDVNDLVKNINSKKGTLLIISHLGNAQMMKGLATLNEAGTEQKMSITTISDANITAGFAALIQKINPDSSFHIISANNIGPETILLLQQRLEKGEVVVIAGDRVSANTDRNIPLSFLGKQASFPYGVFLMTALLNVPAYFVCGLRHKDISLKTEYDMFVKKNEISFDCSRKEREERITKTAEAYARNLEKLCHLHPYQWYNFYKFWK